MNKLAQYLTDRKITQAEFAARIGVTQAMVSRLAKGKAQPSPDVAVRIERETDGIAPFHAWPAYSAFADDRGAA